MSKEQNTEINFKNPSQAINQAWNQHIWPPFTQIALSSPPDRVVTGKGALLYREGGLPLIDAISSWWVTLHGHSNPYIAKAVSKQASKLEQVIFADFIHPQAEYLAKRLYRLTKLERLFFSDNGSTAVEVAIKIACQFWQNNRENRTQIIAFEGAYHGDTFGAMSVGERNLFNAPFEKMLFPVKRVPWPEDWWGNEEIETHERLALTKLKNHLLTPTAAVILEPLIQGAGGMKIVRKKFLLDVQRVVQESGALLIADEVLTGFGRTGKLFASLNAGISPDLMAISKGLTGGFLPMGITLAKEKIFEKFLSEDPKHTFWHGHSFTANPLGCAAANASLDLLEKSPEMYENFENRHRPYVERISRKENIEKPRLIGNISAFNLCNRGEKGYLNKARLTIKKRAMEKGVFIRPLGNVIYLMPPLCINDSQLEKCYSVISDIIDDL